MPVGKDEVLVVCRCYKGFTGRTMSSTLNVGSRSEQAQLSTWAVTQQGGYHSTKSGWAEISGSSWCKGWQQSLPGVENSENRGQRGTWGQIT
ncbi:hypothetical protein Cadr_000027335 [Camelus dromedarius]|uniref:Uncharacterized protein n=1 Tax=Camelus dromedarius TaxID=9838 RepID=A0A5N4CDQ4_CAMDR|nr:hypothetical protein Cadr_000027335 [Camelus dromedarius]